MITDIQMRLKRENASKRLGRCSPVELYPDAVEQENSDGFRS